MATRPGMLSLSIKDKASLYASYMPYVKNGGLFIPTNKVYTLGDEVFMLLTLMAICLMVIGFVVGLAFGGLHGGWFGLIIATVIWLVLTLVSFS